MFDSARQFIFISFFVNLLNTVLSLAFLLPIRDTQAYYL